MKMNSVIFGCAGTILSADERAFFADAKPWAFILFARNLDTPEQIKKLCADLRDAVGYNAPILVDQEGGRVARLRAPEWREWLPPLEQMSCVAPENARQAMVLRYRLIAHELHTLGIDVNCAPMLDVPTPDAHEIITNRCYGTTSDTVAEMGRACAEGLLAGGVLPIIKHIPGHGRGSADSHFELPVVDTDADTLDKVDFEPFRRLSDLPMAMTAHIVYTALDANACATVSPTMIDVIRNSIGFDGLLMTDDLSMKALKGSFAEKTAASLNAGCDVVLHCNGELDEMTQIMTEVPALSGVALARATTAQDMRKAPEPFDADGADSLFASLL
jgi:beta-N-acetylhexosaminidase